MSTYHYVYGGNRMTKPGTPRLTVLGTDRAKIDALASGRVPFFEPGLPEMLRKALDSGRLSFTTDLAKAGLCRARDYVEVFATELVAA